MLKPSNKEEVKTKQISRSFLDNKNINHLDSLTSCFDSNLFSPKRMLSLDIFKKKKSESLKWWRQKWCEGLQLHDFQASERRRGRTSEQQDDNLWLNVALQRTVEVLQHHCSQREANSLPRSLRCQYREQNCLPFWILKCSLRTK